MKREFIKSETFDGTFPWQPRFKAINGFDMHYVDEGKGEPIVCLHGMPTWGYLYREFIKDLSKGYRVVVPDHMGFGKSDVPQDKPYTMAQHVDNLAKLVLAIGLKDITLVMQDWGGPIGFGFAVDHPDLVKRLVILNTSVGVMREGTKPWYQDFEKRGIYEQFFSNMKENLPRLLQGGLYHPERVTPLMLRAYTSPFPAAEYCKGAVAFPRDIPIGMSHPTAAFMQSVRDKLDRLVKTPKILIWGMQDIVFSPAVIDRWHKFYPGTPVHQVEDAGHFLQEDAPAEIISTIRLFCSQF